MDWADRVNNYPQGHGKVDPLVGMNLTREYELVIEGESSYHTRIQKMIVDRVEKGI